MSLLARLRKAIAGRRKRTMDLVGDERKQRRSLAWRRRRTAELLKEYKADKTPERLERYRKSRALVAESAKRTTAMHRLTQRSRAKLADWRRKLTRAKGGDGTAVVRSAQKMVGKTETGMNDAPWLRDMEARCVNAGIAISWMIPGQPYCGMGVIWSYLDGLGIELPAGTVYTPNIASYAGMIFTGRGGLRYKLVRVSPENAKPGAIVVFDWSPGSGADHTGVARGPMRGGVVPTTEFNTSPSNQGSQSNGGGVWNRTRFRANVLAVLNVERA